MLTNQLFQLCGVVNLVNGCFPAPSQLLPVNINLLVKAPSLYTLRRLSGVLKNYMDIAL